MEKEWEYLQRQEYDLSIKINMKRGKTKWNSHWKVKVNISAEMVLNKHWMNFFQVGGNQNLSCRQDLKL